MCEHLDNLLKMFKVEFPSQYQRLQSIINVLLILHPYISWYGSVGVNLWKNININIVNWAGNYDHMTPFVKTT